MKGGIFQYNINRGVGITGCVGVWGVGEETRKLTITLLLRNIIIILEIGGERSFIFVR